MLLSRAEMSFDFHGAKLDPKTDKRLLGWIFNQFLYGEVTGIQVGHWLYGAPDLDAARFLSRQAVEEMQHIDNFLTILRQLEVAPALPHFALRFMATGMMGQNWAEHVAIEMAQGEGLVLMALYAVIDTLDHPEIVAILKRAVKQEERHVSFGEERTRALLMDQPDFRPRLLGLALVSMLATAQIARFAGRLLPDHPVIKQLPEFLRAALAASELRLLRMGVLERPLAKLSWTERTKLIAGAYARKLSDNLFSFGSPPRLTDHFLTDPYLHSERHTAH